MSTIVWLPATVCIYVYLQSEACSRIFYGEVLMFKHNRFTMQMKIITHFSRHGLTKTRKHGFQDLKTLDFSQGLNLYNIFFYSIQKRIYKIQ